MDPLQKLLENLRKRTSGGRFGYGPTTADAYLRHVSDCAGSEGCAAHFGEALKGRDWEGLLKEAASRPVWSTEDMRVDAKSLVTNSTDFRTILKSDSSIEIPPKTIMVFRNIITTPQVDRDGDVLETRGAEPDPNMPLLWQHLHVHPIGRMLEIIDHSAQVLRVASAIIDSPLGNDAAQLIEFGALRISHGFIPKEFEELSRDDAGDHPWPGFRINRFEVMEESVVSVPSNVGAVIEAFSRGKLSDPIVKQWAEHQYKNRDTAGQQPGVKMPLATINGDSTVTVSAKDGMTSVSRTDGVLSVTHVPSQDDKAAACSCPTGGEEPEGKQAGNEGEGSGAKRSHLLGPVISGLQGSYEQVQCELEQDGKRWLMNQRDIPFGDHDWTSLVATFDGEAVICWVGSSRPYSEDKCYIGSWEYDEDVAVFVGEPREVSLSAQINERAQQLAEKYKQSLQPDNAESLAQKLLVASGDADPGLLRRVAAACGNFAEAKEQEQQARENQEFFAQFLN